MIKCHKCGLDMIWDNDYDLADFDCEAEGLLSFYHCDNCNITYEITEYWNEGEDE